MSRDVKEFAFWNLYWNLCWNWKLNLKLEKCMWTFENCTWIWNACHISKSVRDAQLEHGNKSQLGDGFSGKVVLGGRGCQTGVGCGRTKWKGRGGSCVERASLCDGGRSLWEGGGLRNDGVLNFRSDGNRPFNELASCLKCVGWYRLLGEVR